MSGEMRIRPMGAEDIDPVMAIAAGLEAAPHWQRPAYEAAIDPEGMPGRVALIAELGGELIGFAVASFVPPQAELETIAVSAAHQRCGAGSVLLGALVRELASRGALEVALEVRASNTAALAFYRGHSFVECGRRPGYYPPPERHGPVSRPHEEQDCFMGTPVSGDPAHRDTGEAAILMRAPIAISGKRE
jgi:ribosomal-protein-alanine N-acetyltransferase